MNDYLKLKIEQLITQTEHLTEENEHLNDLLFEAGENLKAAEDQNHYFKLMSQYRDKSHELEKELQETKAQLEKAEQRIFHLAECSSLWEYQGICDCGYEQYFKDKQGSER